VLDKEITEELQVGQPISIGSREWNWGSISLDEVSIVRQGAVKGYAPPAVIGVDAFEPADVDRAVVVDPNRDPAWVPSLGLERRLVKPACGGPTIDDGHSATEHRAYAHVEHPARRRRKVSS